MLKNSTRKSSLTRSVNGVSFVTEKSQVFIPCARKVGSTRDSLPRLNGPGAAKHAAFMTEVPAVRWLRIEPLADSLHPGRTLGRIVPAPKYVDRSFGAALMMDMGKPLASVVIPLTVQPDTSLLATPVASAKKCFPGPNGRTWM